MHLLCLDLCPTASFSTHTHTGDFLFDSENSRLPFLHCRASSTFLTLKGKDLAFRACFFPLSTRSSFIFLPKVSYFFETFLFSESFCLSRWYFVLLLEFLAK